MKMTQKMLAFIIPILLLAVFTCSVNARGGVFVIQPHQKAVQSLPSLNTAESAAGNVSADGFIDFYVLGPSGTVLQCYNRTGFVEFKVSPDTEGMCTLHMANNYEAKNVIVNLQYGINFVIVATASLTLQIPPTSITITPTQPFDWSGVVDFLKTVGSFIFTILYPLIKAIRSFIDWVKNLRWKRWWKKKYGKPRTPSTVRDFSSQPPLVIDG